MTEHNLPHLTSVGVHAKCLELGFVTMFGLIIAKLNDDMPNLVGFRTLGNQRHFFPPESPIVVYGDVGREVALTALQVDIERG